MKVEATPEQDAMVQAFARAIEQAGGKALLVGGLVRDEILGLPSKDFDFEVFGLPMERVQAILQRFGNVKEVGQQFGVLNIQELDWDVALPRREQKTGEGHKGFDVVPDPTMSVEDAARRRDLTINALSKDPLTGEIIDPLNGMADLKAGILRMADPNTFGDDPLRALRVAQFAARFDFDVEPETLKVVAAQPLEQLPGERILPEFSKMLLKGQKPSKGIEVLRQANLLRYFPEIEALQGVPQEEKWHPEGDVYIHTMMVLDEAGKQRTGDPEFDLPLMLGALAHDFGKPMTTEEIDGKLTSRGHEEAGVAPTNDFMTRMKAPLALTKQVETLVSFHLRPAILPNTGGGRKGYRKLGRELDDGGVSPELLAAMSKADVLGRTTDAALRRDVSSQDKFLEEYNEHVTSQAAPGGKLVDSVSGKHLIAKGFKPGPEMGKFLALTRSIEDETGVTDPDKLIELATRFLKDRSEGGGSQDGNQNDCGDSHIREGEECFDGDYREQRKKGNTKSFTADLDWTVGRPCEDGPEEYPEKCTGPGSSAEDPYGPHDAPDEQWELPPADTNPHQPGEELALPPELQEPTPSGPETPMQLGPDAWNLPFSPEELNDPRQNALDEKMLKKTEKDAANKQNAADKAMLKKVQEEQKAQKLAEKLAEKEQAQQQKLVDKEAKDAQSLENKFAQNRKRKADEANKPVKTDDAIAPPGPGASWEDIMKYVTGLDPKLAEKLQGLKDQQGAATSTMGPSAFRTHPDKTQPDYLLWEKFEWPADQKGKSQHPGLASVILGEPRPCYPTEDPVEDHCNDGVAPPTSGGGGALTEHDTLLLNDQARLQHSTKPEEIAGLTAAWNDAKAAVHANPEFLNDPHQAEAFALGLATKIDPRNNGGYRKVPVTFGPGKPPALSPDLVPRAMEGLFGAYADQVMEPDEWYHEFEKVHPLEDGNGRLGDLLWKMDKVRRGEPWPNTHPPDFFGTDTSDYTASVTAEPQRLHERTNKYPGVKDFDRGSRFSEHPLEGPLGRDGFGGSTPAPMEELEDRPNGMTPETGIFPDWEGDPAQAYETPNNATPGFLPVQLPLPQMPETSTPHPSPTRSAEESPPSSFPGQMVRKPGGGGLDRAPMIKPRGADQETGFLPVQNPPQPNRNMFKAELDPEKVHGPGGNNPGGTLNDQGRGGRGGGTKRRDYWDMDYTGKKSGFMSIEPPDENIYPAETEAARTMEDLMEIEVIHPHDYNPDWKGGGVSMGPSIKHQNVRKTHDQGLDPFPKGFGPDGEVLEGKAVEADDDANIEQKQVQPLIPNQKMAIAVDPKGPMGERIVIMSPLFEEVSPAIMALRSHRFERHGGIVIDGPPEWLLGITPRLEALDKSSGHDGADDLFARVQQLIQSAGMPIEYEQQPRP